MPISIVRRRTLVLCAALAAAGVHCSGGAPDASSASDSQGVSASGAIHPFASSGLCLDVVGQSTANGAAVQVWSCSGNPNQQWTYDGTSLRVYGNKCLDVTGGNTADGTKLQIWDCAAGNRNQKWTRSGSTFQWANHGKCLDLTDGLAQNGTLAQSWTCFAGDTNQEWNVAGGSGGGSSGSSSGGSSGSGSGSGSSGSSGGGTGSGSGGGAGDDAGAPSAIDYAPYFPTWVWGGGGYAFNGLADLQNKAGLHGVTLAFVLSNGGCNTTQDIEQNLGDVKAFIAAGGHVKASFGGAAGSYVESQCGDASSLASAIEGFVDATGITDLDFDIEQDPMLTDAVNAMRGQALKMVQDSRGIRVAFTLAANPPPGGGLTSQGQSVVSHAVAAGVKISHVNFMTMDYGNSFGGQPMAPIVTGTLSDGQAQIMSLVPGITSQQAWAMVGVIPMIGKNDDAEIFSLSDAQTLAQFAKQNGVGLVSFWSIDRDQPGSNYNTSSTVQSTNFAFNAILQAVTK